jgi:hypothetical protein
VYHRVAFSIQPHCFCTVYMLGPLPWEMVHDAALLHSKSTPQIGKLAAFPALLFTSLTRAHDVERADRCSDGRRP